MPIRSYLPVDLSVGMEILESLENISQCRCYDNLVQDSALYTFGLNVLDNIQ